MLTTIMLNNFVLCLFFAVSGGLVLNSNDVNNIFYELNNINTDEEKPEIHYLQKSTDNLGVKQNYDVMNFENLKYTVNKNDFNDYVIVKAKRKLIDMSPYMMMRQLDDIKYMVVWLNLYCEIHPDCNKKILNEELHKVRNEYYFNL